MCRGSWLRDNLTPESKMDLQERKQMFVDEASFVAEIVSSLRATAKT